MENMKEHIVALQELNLKFDAARNLVDRLNNVMQDIGEVVERVNSAVELPTEEF